MYHIHLMRCIISCPMHSDSKEGDSSETAALTVVAPGPLAAWHLPGPNRATSRPGDVTLVTRPP